METIYLILWKYNDGSGSGAVRAYTTQDEADKTMLLLNEHGDIGKNFYVQEVPLIDA